MLTPASQHSVLTYVFLVCADRADTYEASEEQNLQTQKCQYRGLRYCFTLLGICVHLRGDTDRKTIVCQRVLQSVDWSQRFFDPMSVSLLVFPAALAPACLRRPLCLMRTLRQDFVCIRLGKMRFRWMEVVLAHACASLARTLCPWYDPLRL